MKDGPVISTVAALLGDPARANMLIALMDGRALTVSELAKVAGVAMPTASGHLTKLNDADLLTSEKQGRHHYFRLSGPDVAEVLEALMGLAQRTGAVRLRTGPKDAALRQARICYDHLAGEKGVALSAGLMSNGWISDEAQPALTSLGRAELASIGLDLATLEQGRRPVCRRCLDWSERQSHLGGALGAALLCLMIERQWARRLEGRVVAFTPAGSRDFASAFGLRAA
jgi:DNA-binding transcriptional ArsR family regulator